MTSETSEKTILEEKTRLGEERESEQTGLGHTALGQTASGEIALAPPWQDTLASAVEYLKQKTRQKPDPQAMAQALIAAEKSARQTGDRPTPEQLVGDWRLGFITGTKKSRERAGVVLGAGRFLPRWVKIQIAYTFQDESAEGSVLNTVNCGPLKLAVSGPIRFFPQRRILAFDFPKMAISLAGLTLFDRYIPKGREREEQFLADGSPQSLRNQAFFTYFLVRPHYIAARGRGGGLALWYREEN